ncbi:MAG: CBS domain-containing protein [Pseudomonadota bacterium]
MNVGAILKVKGHNVVTISRDATLQSAVTMLANKKIGAVVVIGEDGGVVGILSERDIIGAIAARGVAALSETLTQTMTAEVVTCDEQEQIDSVMETMTSGRFRHVPVLNSGQLVGIVSIGDVVKTHIAEVVHEAEALKAYLSS